MKESQLVDAASIYPACGNAMLSRLAFDHTAFLCWSNYSVYPSAVPAFANMGTFRYTLVAHMQFHLQGIECALRCAALCIGLLVMSKSTHASSHYWSLS